MSQRSEAQVIPVDENPRPSKLKAFPFYIHKTADGVLLKRGGTEVAIQGAGAAAFINTVVSATLPDGATREDICKLFPFVERAAVQKLLDHLITSRLLVAPDETRAADGYTESNLDLFYWQFKSTADGVTKRLNEAGIVVVGVNSISRQLIQAFLDTNLDNFAVLDDPNLRNLRLFDAKGLLKEGSWPVSSKRPLNATEWKRTSRPSLGCIVATSDFGNQQTLLEWNRYCVQHHYRFLPIFLQNFVGYVGPLVVPNETACFDCLRARWNAHLDQNETKGAVDELAVDAQKVIGFHPSMASILGDIASFELAKVYSQALPNPRVGTVLEVNLLVPRLQARRVLKIPRCATCSPLNLRTGVSAKK